MTDDMNIRIISVDPAPSKKSAVFDDAKPFDGKYIKLMEPWELDKHLKEVKKESCFVLVAWDAPLTGPWSLNFDELEKTHEKKCFSPFYMRAIEKEFGPKYQDAVSVLGYAGCSHWAISRAILGLPRVGQYCKAETPYTLLTDNPPKKQSGHYVVESHPALGMAMLLGKDSYEPLKTYKKKDKKTFAADREEATKRLVKLIATYCKTYCKELKLTEYGIFEEIKKDDELDAFVGYLLAKLWLTKPKLVEIYRNKEDGAILLPSSPRR